MATDGIDLLKSKRIKRRKARKETANKDILKTSKNGNRKIVETIQIASKHSGRMRKWNHFSQFRWTKVIPNRRLKLAKFLKWAKDSREAVNEESKVLNISCYRKLSNTSKWKLVAPPDMETLLHARSCFS